jgi:2,3-bisphosphoglycerate-dependent phosphoglycerate mutase
MELILVRHALPERVEDVDGVADPALTPEGVVQAERMAAWLAHEHIDHLAVSPKRRARETAAPLEARTGLIGEVIPQFSEIDRTSRTYIPIEEMRAENGPHWQALVNGRWSDIGYADPLVFKEEVGRAAQALIQDRDGQRIVVVAHGGTINAIVAELTRLERMFIFEPSYTSISRIGIGFNGRLRITSLNETAHLEAERFSLPTAPCSHRQADPEVRAHGARDRGPAGTRRRRAAHERLLPPSGSQGSGAGRGHRRSLRGHHPRSAARRDRAQGSDPLWLLVGGAHHRSCLRRF